MDIESIVRIFSLDDGSLPDINFNFNGDNIVDIAYQYIQGFSARLAGINFRYWSTSKCSEVPILFGDNPALQVKERKAEPFHVVFGGVKSGSGKRVPDLGVYILASDYFSLDYRMGKSWNAEAVIGLFEVMSELEALSSNTTIHHEGNVFEKSDELMMAYRYWKNT